MGEDPLISFLREVRERLKILPPDERERRYAEICERLESTVAASLALGGDEETAVSEAIVGLDLSYLTAPEPFGGGILRRLHTLPDFMLTALYAVVAHKFIGLALGRLFSLIISLSLPQDLVGRLRNGLSEAGPSLIFAWVALAAILLRDGPSRAFRKATSLSTAAGSGVFWIALTQSLVTILGIVFVFLLRAVDPDPAAMGWWNDFLVFLLFLSLVLMPAAPFFAGWVAGRKSPRQSVSGVRIAAIASFLLIFIEDMIALFGSPGGAPLFPGILFLLLLAVIQAMYFGLGIAGVIVGSYSRPLPPKRKD